MICEYTVKLYCSEDLSLIENYYEAISSKEKWDCHHRLETDLGLSAQELKDTNRYYSVEAKYLIFLKHTEHVSLHMKGSVLPDETKSKISNTLKGHISWFKDCNHTNDVKQQISKKMKGNHNGAGNKNKHLHKYKWRTPTGEIIEMDAQNVNRWHPDWILIE